MGRKPTAPEGCPSSSHSVLDV